MNRSASRVADFRSNREQSRSALSWAVAHAIPVDTDNIDSFSITFPINLRGAFFAFGASLRYRVIADDEDLAPITAVAEVGSDFLNL